MKGANKAFMAQPVAWLRGNMIFYNVRQGAANPFAQPEAATGPTGELPIQQFDLRPTGGMTDQAGLALQAYELCELSEAVGKKARKVGSTTHPIRAYFLPWGTGKSFRGRLGTQADFFFTPTLNGCTFAAEGNLASPMVVHSNHVDLAAQTIDQTRIEQDLGAVFGGGGPGKAIRRGDYKVAATGTEDYRVTIVGIREGTRWRFFYQRYKQDLAAGGVMLVNTALNRRVEL